MGLVWSAGRAASETSLFGSRAWASRVPRALYRNGPAPRYVRNVAGLVLCYYAAAHLGYAFHFSGPVAAVVWLPVGVGIAFLYLGGTKLWPGVVLGDLLVNNYSTLPVGTALGQSFGNLLEVIVAAELLRRLSSRREPLATVRGVGGMVVAIAVGTVLSATIGSIASWLGAAISFSSLPHVWRTWWLGDLSGALIVLPLALGWARPLPRTWRWTSVLEATVTAAGVIGLSAIALTGTGMTWTLMLPALIWVALRFGSRGATLAIMVMSGFAIWESSHALGPFGIGSIGGPLLGTQLFIATLALSALSITALATERERLIERVRASRARLVTASDEARRRLERDLHDGAQQRLVALAARLTRSAIQAPEAHERAAADFEAAASDVLMAIEELREFAHGIHPSILRHFGLADAVRAIAARSAIKIDPIDLPRQRLDDTSEATAYYIVLEAITNAQRYARASAVSVRARLNCRRLILDVADDGVGGAIEREGSGLQGLRDRVEATRGRFRFESQPGRGTHITAEFPVGFRPGRSGRLAERS